jgi:hypothetical protein
MKWVVELALALAMLGVGVYEISSGLTKMRSVAADATTTDRSDKSQ